MVSNISYKLSAFADYTNISYTSEKIMRAINAFKGLDFLPNVISEMLAGGSVSQRIQLRTASGGLSITILSERIDVELSSGRKEGFSDDEKKSLRSEIYQLLKTVYQSNSTDDLLVRFSGRDESSIAGHLETINAITTISRLISVPGALIEVDGYKIDFDINTWQENRKNRFDCPNIENFIAVACEYQNKLEADFIK